MSADSKIALELPNKDWLAEDWLALDFAENRPCRTQILAWTVAHPFQTLIAANVMLWGLVFSAMVFG